jgi:hypothetical protein
MDGKHHGEALFHESKCHWKQIENPKLFPYLLPHDDEKDIVFTDTDLKALLLKAIPSSWQNAYLLRGTCTSDNFPHIHSYFIQLQSITDNQTVAKYFSASQHLDNGKQLNYVCTDCGQSGFFFLHSE